jgi:hypothetical protein
MLAKVGFGQLGQGTGADKVWLSLDCAVGAASLVVDGFGAPDPDAAIDVFGFCGERTAAHGGAGGFTTNSANLVMYRKPAVIAPSQSFDVAEWDQQTFASVDLALSGSHYANVWRDDDVCLPHAGCGSADDILIISEVGKGSGSHKWVEIYNPTNHDINLEPTFGAANDDKKERYYFMGFNNGATTLPGIPQKLGLASQAANGAGCQGAEGSNPCWTKIIPARGLYILCHSGGDAAAITDCHHTFAGSGFNFNG